MSYIGDTGIDLTSSEVEMIENLSALVTSSATQAIQKTGATTFDNVELNVSGAIWGQLTGTLSDQTDLQAALDGKLSVTLTDTSVNDLIVYDGTNWINNTGIRNFFNGTFIETFDATVASDGATITMSLEQSGGGDLTMLFSDGQTTLDCTPIATVSLTPGTDAVPVKNFVYIPQSTKVLTVATDAWPSAEHIKVAFILCQSAATTQTRDPLINQNWNDHAAGTNNQGHLSHITQKIRQSIGATYGSGVAFTFTAGPAANIYLSTTAGVVDQMHPHTFPATEMPTDDIHLVNHNATPYTTITDLASITADSAGVTLSNKFFNVVFFGVANKTGEEDHIMALLPSGSYAVQADAENDVDNYTTYTIPSVYTRDSGTAFYICEALFKWSGGTTNLQTVSSTDLRGRNPDSITGGGAGLALTEFSDTQFKLFDDGDSTKILQFQLSGLTTATTRTLTAPDANGTIMLTSAIGTTVQAYDADLAGIAALTITSNDLIVGNGSNTFTTTQITTFGKSLIDDANAATARATLDVDQAGTDNSTNVTIAAGLDYITITGQELTLGSVDLAADVTGTLPIGNGGTGQTTAQAAIDALTQVSAATNEYVLTKDTATGNAVWKEASGGGASTALDNLASVAINTTLVSDTYNTDALGTSAIAWSDLFLGNGAVIEFSSAASTPDVTLTHSANTLTLGGGDLALGANNLTMTGSLGATAARLTKGWFTDLEVTNAIAGSITGNAATVTNATLTTALTVNTGALTLTANADNTSVLTIGSGAVSVSGSNTGDQDLSGYVTKATFDAHTVLYATADDTPLALSVTEQTLVGRLTGGNISAVAIGIADNNILQVDQADATDNDYAKFTANGIEGRSYSEVAGDIGSSITTVGTISTGVWEATDVGVAHGGTGKSSWTQYLIPYADTTTSFSQIAIGTSGQVLTSNGAGSAPTFQDAVGGGLTTQVYTPGDIFPGNNASFGFYDGGAGDNATIKITDTSGQNDFHMSGYIAGTVSSVTMYCAPESGGVLKWYVNTKFGTSGEERNNHTDSIGSDGTPQTTGTLTSDQIFTLDLTNAFTDATSGDIFGLNFFRDAADAGDTISNLHIFAIVITYS